MSSANGQKINDRILKGSIMNIKIFMIAMFVTNITSIHIITMHKERSKKLAPFAQLQAIQARHSKPLLVSFEENEEGITYRVSGFIQDNTPKLREFSTKNHSVQEDRLSELNEKKLFSELFIKPFTVYSHNKHHTSFNVSGLTKDEQYTDYLMLFRTNRLDKPNDFWGTLTRIKKASMYNNLNFELQAPGTYILDPAIAEHYWLSAEKSLKKQRKAKKNHSS